MKDISLAIIIIIFLNIIFKISESSSMTTVPLHDWAYKRHASQEIV